MTSENTAEGPAEETASAADPGGTPVPPAARHRPVPDWDREPTHGVDPEDSLRDPGPGSDLARLLADLPPHHVDR
jgi:hypothetical protein